MGPLAARRRLAAGAAAFALALLGGCGTGSGAGSDGGPSFEARPQGRASTPRSGHLTWRLGAVERLSETEVRVDLRLHNGTHRAYDAVMLRVTAHGPEGETRSLRLPVGGMRDDQSRSASARFAEIPFPVHDVSLELLYAVP